ncbi:MAG: carboxyl transferase domain-containing protein [Eubacteriales bacterium]|nr:carboxyl transferase domain-containing protein [Eubacteriales bacterium]
MAVSNAVAVSRINSVLDAGSFVEIGALVAGNGDGVVTGYGTIEGRLVYVYSQDASVLGGSIGELHAKKISNIYNMALKMGAPVLSFVDCAGVRITEGNDSLYSFGKVFAHQAKVSGVVPQITAVYGNCGGGMAVSAAMSDFIFMEKGGKLFVNSPNAVIGNYEEKLDTASAEFNATKTGIVDAYGTEDEVAANIRELFDMLPLNNETALNDIECTDDLNRAVAGIEKMTKVEALKQIADDGKFFELKRGYTEGLKIGLLKLNGHTVGAVANEKKSMCHKNMKKAIKFLRFCDAFNIPVVTLADVTEFDRTKHNEVNAAQAASKLAFTYASLTVPTVTIATGEVYGTAGIVMGSKSLGVDLYYAWTNAKMGIMDKASLDKLTDANKDKDVYSANYNAERGYVDEIITPAETRQRLAAAFEMLYSKDVAMPLRKHGTV